MIEVISSPSNNTLKHVKKLHKKNTGKNTSNLYLKAKKQFWKPWNPIVQLI